MNFLNIISKIKLTIKIVNEVINFIDENKHIVINVFDKVESIINEEKQATTQELKDVEK